MNNHTFHISIPSSDGFVGNTCSDKNCSKYFKVKTTDFRETMHCPYCGNLASKVELRTPEQMNYVKKVAKEKAMEIAYKQINGMFKNLADSTRGNKSITFKHNPISYRPKVIWPTYSEKKVDTELTCPECAITFQVYGIFGYCPGCRIENMIIYDTNIQIIKQECEKQNNNERVLRHAYSDLVSTFELFCKNKISSVEPYRGKYQDLFEARRYFKESFGVDILSEVRDSDLLVIRRVFQKRHAYVHSDGTIDEKYAKKIPEEAKLIGNKATLSFEEFWEAAMILRRVIYTISRINLT